MSSNSHLHFGKSSSVSSPGEEDDFMGFQSWSYTDLTDPFTSQQSIPNETKGILDKLKDIEAHLSHNAPYSSNLNHHQLTQPQPQHQHQMQQTYQPHPQPQQVHYHHNSEMHPLSRSDHEILEEFDRVGSQTNFVEKWPLLQLPQKLEEVLHQLSILQKKLIRQEILLWKHENQLAKNGLKAFSKNLDEIQSQCEGLLEVHLLFQRNIYSLHEMTQMSQSSPSHHRYPNLQLLKENAASLLSEFLNSTFIVEVEPVQVIKINTRFAQPVTLRHLLGSKLYPKSKYSFIKANIIRESMARQLVEEWHCRSNGGLDTKVGGGVFKSSGIILNGTAKMSLIEGRYVGHFKNLQLRKIDRKSKKLKGLGLGGSSPATKVSKSSEHPPFNPDKSSSKVGPSVENPDESLASTVTDEKFCLHFHTEISCGSTNFSIWTLSLPVVVVTHGVQESQAWATVTWDNAFGTSKEPMLPLVHRVPFVVPHTVPWESLAQMLSIKFEQTAGKGLEDFQLKSLKQKLLPDSLTNLSVEAQVSFTRLSKLPLTGTSFSFWEWFYSAMKLVEKHALRSWKNGSIYGFIARKDAEIALQGSNPGTFLVRFSDTVLGGITITYVAKNGQVHSVTPFTTKNLTFRSLADSIWDLDNLTNLYPNNLPKIKAFPSVPQGQSHYNSGQCEGSSSTIQSLNSTNQSATRALPMSFRLISNYVICVPKITLPSQYS